MIVGMNTRGGIVVEGCVNGVGVERWEWWVDSLHSRFPVLLPFLFFISVSLPTTPLPHRTSKGNLLPTLILVLHHHTRKAGRSVLHHLAIST